MRKYFVKYEYLAYAVLLILVSALTYLPLIGQIGYLNDDWYLMYSAGAYGPDAFTSIFSVDRPARALVMIPAYSLFGGNPLYYNLSAYAFRLFSALTLMWLLRLLWGKHMHVIFTASLLYLIYPGFLSQMNGIDYQSQMVSLAAAMLSVALSMKAVFAENIWQKIILLSFSIVLGWLYLGLVEYFLGFELLRLLCIFLLAYRMDLPWKSRLLKGIKDWLPNTFTVIVFLVWRVFFFQGDRSATDVNIQFEQAKLYPVQTLYHWTVQVVQDMFDVLVSAWAIPITQLAEYIHVWSVVLALVMAGLLIYVLYLAQYGENQAPSAKDFFYEALLLGFFVAAGGLMPIAMVNREVSFPSYSRYSLASSVGVAIFLATILMRLTNRTLRNGLILALVFISTLTHYANTAKAVTQTASTREFWWQVSWRVPHLEKNATLLASYPNVPIEEDYFVWGPANLIYYPEKVNPKGIQPGIFAALVNQKTVDKVLAMERQEYDKRKTIVTYANYRNILVLTRPTVNSCVHVIDGFNPEYSQGEWGLIREVEPYSEIEHVLADETHHTPPEIAFGPEPAHGWCYYYQKADLARQQGNWNKVLEIGQQAFDQGLSPADPIEWMPFLQAYAQTENVDRLKELAPTISADPFIAQQVCRILGSAFGTTPQVIETIDSLYCPK